MYICYSRDDSDDFYCDNPNLPVYQWTKRNQCFTVEEVAKILIVDSIPSDKICSKQPVRVCKNVAFIVDLDSLDDKHDV